MTPMRIIFAAPQVGKASVCDLQKEVVSCC